jgi:hypothetical protein
VPNAANSTVRPICLLPRNGTAVNPLTTQRAGIPTLYCITVKDANNAAVAGATVVLDFAPCTTAGATDIEICSFQAGGPTPPLHTATCGALERSVTVTADVNGLACFNIVGNSNGAGVANSAPCIKVYADTQLLGTVDYVAYDHDGSVGTGGADLFLFFQDQLNNRFRSNYDTTGVVGGADLFLFFQVQSNGATNGQSCQPANTDCVP